MTRGVIYVYWGNKFEQELQRSMESLKRYHPDIPVEVFKLADNSSHLNKTAMLDYSPFDTTLYLDTDTTVLGNLDYGFDRAEKFGLACCINECPWARRFAEHTGDMVEYNSGVLFFTKKAKPVFDMWKECAKTVDSSIRFYLGDKVVMQPVADQGSFAAAMEKSHFNPNVLPFNWNFRPMWHKTFWGPIKVWHDHSEVPEWVHMWNEGQILEQSIIRYGSSPQ